jgi:hypothetical protein
MTIPEPLPWLATPEDVAALLRARTKDETGRELGSWSDATRPTYDEVAQLIELARMQATDADGPAQTACGPLCRTVIALHAACLVELSYFPEQVRSDRSPYSELRDMLTDAQAAYSLCREAGSPDASVGEGWTYHSLPVRPAISEQLIGWRNPEFPRTWQRPCFPPTAAEPANIDEPDRLGEPVQDIVIGHPAEGDVELGLPPIITDPDG